MTGLFALITRSLFTQVLAVSLAGIAGMIAIFLILFQTSLVFRLFPGALEGASEDVSELVLLVENVPEDMTPVLLSSFGGPSRFARITERLPGEARKIEALERRLVSGGETAQAVLAKRDIHFRYYTAQKVWRGNAGNTGNTGDKTNSALPGYTALEIFIGLEDGRTLSVVLSVNSLFVKRPIPVIFILMIASICMGAVMVVLIRQAFRPLRRLEEAAQRFGTLPGSEPAEETGAEEVRRLARVFNHMQDRVHTLRLERTRMFSAVAHDIRTSLTRIRLRLERAEDPHVLDVQRDLDEIQSLIGDMLTFARANEPTTRREVINLPDFIRSYAEDAPDDLAFDAQSCKTPFEIAADPSALRRSLNNLIDNARRYGGGADLSCRSTAAGFEIRVLDHGPGIPEEQLAKVFEPFYRLDHSRSRDTGGTGLGLGIAKALIRVQSGDLRLQNQSGGGLCAIIHFSDDCRLE